MDAKLISYSGKERTISNDVRGNCSGWLDFHV